MKNLLLVILGITLLVALFGDGGLEVSPTVSPRADVQFEPKFDFSPNVSYAPDNSTTHIDTNVEQQTVIEQQTIIVQPNAVPGGNGVTVFDPAFQLCHPAPGETIIQGPDTKGACFVKDQAGNEFFLNAAGSRWPLGSGNGGLQPQAADLSLDQLQAAFLRNGGQLPWFWDTRSEAAQVDWLKEQSETWK